jgi:hypothetical protein
MEQMNTAGVTDADSFQLQKLVRTRSAGAAGPACDSASTSDRWVMIAFLDRCDFARVCFQPFIVTHGPDLYSALFLVSLRSQGAAAARARISQHRSRSVSLDTVRFVSDAGDDCAFRNPAIWALSAIN